VISQSATAMGKTRDAQMSRFASGKGLIIGVSLEVIAAIAVGRLELHGRMTPAHTPPPERSAADSHTATLEEMTSAAVAEVDARKVLTNKVAALDEELSMLQILRDQASVVPGDRSEAARLRDLWESHELDRASIANRARREGLQVR